MKIRLASLCFFVLASTFAQAALPEVAPKPSAIYGEDDRKDLHEVTDPRILELARSVAGMTLTQFVEEREDHFELVTELYGKRNNLCRDARYYEQPAVMNCTAFLIGPDRVALAGHCVDEGSCPSRVFAFGFGLEAPGSDPRRIPKKDFYSCRRVLAREKDAQLDFAVVQLDREVEGRQPLKLRSSGMMAPGEGVFILGHPLGAPLKFADHAAIRKVDPKGDFYTADVDSFAANSGSPMFNARTLEVEGIIVRGGPDFEWDQERDCRNVKHEPQDGGRGEDATAIARVLEKLAETQASPGSPAAKPLVGAVAGMDFSGVGEINGCTATLVKRAGGDPSFATIVTNGHCVGRIPPGEIWQDRPRSVEVRFLSPTLRRMIAVETDRIEWATMSGTDVAVLRTPEAAALREAGISGLPVASRPAIAGAPVRRLTFFRGLQSAECRITGEVHELRESRWAWSRSLRHDCEVWPGTSGSPLIDPVNGEIVALHNTANEDGASCTENNPCEVDGAGAIRVERGAGYAQRLPELGWAE